MIEKTKITFIDNSITNVGLKYEEFMKLLSKADDYGDKFIYTENFCINIEQIKFVARNYIYEYE